VAIGLGLLLASALAAGLALFLRNRATVTGDFQIGDRVVVSPNYHWAKGAKGTIARPPGAVANLAGDWKGHYRVVQTLHGPATFFWISFDTPQRDADGDGPYDGGEIDAKYDARGE
jgi:hypothetical protein